MNINVNYLYIPHHKPNKVMIMIHLVIIQNRQHIHIWAVPSVYQWVGLTTKISNSFINLNNDCIQVLFRIFTPCNKPWSFTDTGKIKITNVHTKVTLGIVVGIFSLRVPCEAIKLWYTLHDGTRLMGDYDNFICNKTFPVFEAIKFDSFVHPNTRVGPYKDLEIMKMQPILEPNSAPAMNHKFSLHGSLRYSPFMYKLRMSMPFNGERRRARHTLSHDTTYAYVELSNGSVWWLPAIKCDFIVRYIFKSNTIRQVISWYQIGLPLSVLE